MGLWARGRIRWWVQGFAKCR